MRKLKASLEADGIACWLDKDNIPAGADYAESIYKAIESKECAAVILFLTPAVLDKSDEICRELDLAKKYGKRVFPFAENVKPEDLQGGIAYRLINSQFADGYKGLLQDLKKDVPLDTSLAAPHTPPVRSQKKRRPIIVCLFLVFLLFAACVLGRHFLIERASCSFLSTKEEIAGLQWRLYELGWLERTDITGTYDRQTKKAVSEYQQYHNRLHANEELSVTGEVDGRTVDWLCVKTALKRPYQTEKNSADSVRFRAVTDSSTSDPLPLIEIADRIDLGEETLSNIPVFIFYPGAVKNIVWNHSYEDLDQQELLLYKVIGESPLLIRSISISPSQTEGSLFTETERDPLSSLEIDVVYCVEHLSSSGAERFFFKVWPSDDWE